MNSLALKSEPRAEHVYCTENDSSSIEMDQHPTKRPAGARRFAPLNADIGSQRVEEKV